MMAGFMHALLLVAGLQAVVMAQGAWTQVATTGPMGRYAHAMAFDGTSGRSILFGGGGAVAGGMLGDTWAWDGRVWAQVATTGPAPRLGSAMAFDSHRRRIVLFGGLGTQNTYFGDTWDWDGNLWLPQLFAFGPTGRYFHAMAYDSQRNRTVIFGGVDNSGLLADTWEWNGLAWTQSATTGPSLRFNHSMAFDSQRGRTVLFGGKDSSPIGILGDTWEWDGLVWTQVATTGPSLRSYHTMVFGERKTVVFGGGDNIGLLSDTWEWNGSAWVQVLAVGPGRGLHAMAYDGLRGRTVLFGGTNHPVNFADTWEWTGTSGTATLFGSGCGLPPLNLSPVVSARPTINSTAQASLSNIPSSVAFVALGWSRTSYGPFQLPVTLAGFGLPGCDLLQSSELATLPTSSTGPGTATLALALPNSPGLIHLHVYLQGWAYAPGVNAAQMIVSNGLDWDIGY